MISALSGNSALSLLSVFGRSQPTSGAQAPTSARRPPPPPPPSQGNGASAKSIFDALLNGSTDSGSGSALDDVLNQLVAGLDQNGDGGLSADELTSGFQTALSGPVAGDKDGGGLGQMVSNIIANLDTDGDQAVSAAELKAGLQTLAANGPPPGKASDAASSLINGLDTNGDGQLSAEELAAAFGSQDQAQPTQKSLQEMLFGLLLDQKDQDQTAQAATLYAA